jgi:hypothetical protein
VQKASEPAIKAAADMLMPFVPKQRFNWAMDLSLEAYEVLPDIGEILRAFAPTECANCFRNSGYAQS